MKKLLTLALLLPALAFGKTGISLTGGLNMPRTSNPDMTFSPEVSPFNLSASFFISIKKLEIGIGGEYGGFETKGKITSYTAKTFFDQQSKDIYTSVSYISPFAYVNYTIKSFPKLSLYAGATVGDIIPQKNTITLYYFEGLGWGPLKPYANILYKKTNFFAGLQIGADFRIAKGLSATAQVAGRYAMMNAETYYISTIFGTTTLSSDINYSVLYWPVSVGFKYRF